MFADNSLKRIRLMVCVALLLSATPIMAAQLPQIPTPMHHLGIALNGNAVEIHGPDPVIPGGMLPLYSYDDPTYDAPADVLDDAAYNDQFGWILEGIISKPAGSSFFLKLIAKDAGLSTYEGGMRMHRANHTYATILDTPGDVWEYPESMTHHWYAVPDDAPGVYALTYEVFLGDAFTAEPLSGYTSDQITLTFVYVPEPGMAAAMLMMCGALTMRRRKHQGGVR